MTQSLFADNILKYISKVYGQSIENSVKSKKHEDVFQRIVVSSEKQNQTVEHAANKIIAMLRMNP